MKQQTNTEKIKATLAEIEMLQAIQKTHPPTSAAWLQASDLLQPLFSEMAKLTDETKHAN